MPYISKEGQKVPHAVFHIREDGKWKNLSTEELFPEGKTVALFSLPGAFTPTCSSVHLPGYNNLMPVLKKNGIDEIVCVSVNDCFVMDAWQKDQKAPNVRFIPDGNGEFTAAMGMTVDDSFIGFNKRSWRYSMIVKNGIISKMFIEPEKEGDPFEVSDAGTMLKFLNAEAKAPENVFLFSRAGCPHCQRARDALKAHEMSFEEVVLGGDITVKSILAVTGKTSSPQVFISGKHIGGADDLVAYLGGLKH